MVLRCGTMASTILLDINESDHPFVGPTPMLNDRPRRLYPAGGWTD